MLYVEIDSSKLEKALRIAPGLLRAELADTIDHISRSFLKKLYQTRFKGPPGLRMGGKGNLFSRFRKRVIGSNQGTLSNRIKSGTVISDIVSSEAATEDLGMEIFTNSPVARIHEFGGTISAPGMPIPFPGKRLSGNLIPMKIGGRLFLGKKRSKQKSIELVAIILNKVRIRPRLGFYSTWGSMENQNIQRLNSAIDKALAKV